VLLNRRTENARNADLSGSLSDFAAFNATRTNLHSFGAALRQCDSDRLQIWIEPAGSSIVSVGDVVPKLRALAANFATFCHVKNLQTEIRR
jgi:hypothetical protein